METAVASEPLNVAAEAAEEGADEADSTGATVKRTVRESRGSFKRTNLAMTSQELMLSQ